MKILKPDTMAVIHRALRWQERDQLAIGLVALFPLDAARLDALRPETELWQRMPQAPGAPAVLDEGYPKAHGEFLLYGEACAPGHAAVPELAVRVRVGTIDKPLLVRGDRHWTVLGAVSAPVPFQRLPIVAATAFGGQGDAVNPFGKGASADTRGQRALPNVEDPKRPIVFKSDAPGPAGYWGVDSSAPQRQRHLGAVGKPWLRDTWPHLPQDTAVDYFQSAPPDQRLPGFFAGDERIELTHLHPEHPGFESSLPALRGRCFAWRGTSASAAFEEIETRAETLWLMPGLGLGAVLYRGTLPVEHEEGTDVSGLVAGWEPMRDAPLPDSHYRKQVPVETPVREAAKAVKASSARAAAAASAQAGAFAMQAAEAAEAGVAAGAAGAAGGAQSAAAAEGAPAALAHAPAAAASAAQPVASALDASTTAAESAGATHPILAEIERETARMSAQTDRLLAEHGIPRSQIDALMQPEPAPAVSLADIDAMRAKVEAERVALLAQSGLTQADVDAFVQSCAGESPTAVNLADIDAQTQAMRQQTEQLMREHGIDHDDVARFLGDRGADAQAVSLMQGFPTLAPRAAAAAAAGEVGAQAQEAQAQEAQAAPVITQAADLGAAPPVLDPTATTAAAAAAAAAPATATATAGEPSAPHPPTTREEVIAWHAGQRSFVGLDLGGLDLSDLDLSGADFSDAKLEATRFDRSRLVASRFDRALLQGAGFEHVDATRASFHAVRAAGTQCTGATFAEAALEAADFHQSNFSGANLEAAHCVRADFSGSRMSGLRAAKLVGERANFSDCMLDGADLAGATLAAARFGLASMLDASLGAIDAERSEWYATDAQRADFASANLRGSRAGFGSLFAGANLRSANLEGAAWSDGVDLRGAAMQMASLGRADFSGAQAAGLLLAGASAEGTDFSQASLQGADAAGANLMGASLRHAQLEGARLSGANLHGSDLYGSTIVEAHVDGALTTRTLIQVAGRPESAGARS